MGELCHLFHPNFKFLKCLRHTSQKTMMRKAEETQGTAYLEIVGSEVYRYKYAALACLGKAVVALWHKKPIDATIDLHDVGFRRISLYCRRMPPYMCTYKCLYR